MANPFLSLWLSQANAWSGAMRGFWTAEMRRQQTQMMNEMTKQAMRFWGVGWMLPAGAATQRRPTPAQQRR